MKNLHIIGRNPVLELLKANRKINRLYILRGDLRGSINEIIKLAEKKNIDIERVDRKRLDSIAAGGVHQGVAALIPEYKYATVDEILNKAKSMSQDPFILILDQIEDPHNLGAIIRTAECAGVHGIIIPKRRSAHVNQTVYSASAGAAEHMLVADVVNITNTIRELKEKGLWIYGADVEGEQYHFNTSLKGPVALVIGNEGRGISRLVKENCDVLVKIPMYGKISSLNASTSAAILIYEVVRQSYEKEEF